MKKKIVAIDNEGGRTPLNFSHGYGPVFELWEKKNRYPDEAVIDSNGWVGFCYGDNVNSTCYSAQRSFGLRYQVWSLKRNGELDENVFESSGNDDIVLDRERLADWEFAHVKFEVA